MEITVNPADGTNEPAYSMAANDLENLAGRSLRYLHKEAGRHAQDRANADYMEAWVKAEKARLKGLMMGVSNAQAEDEALRHPKYLEALEAKKQADAIHYENMFKRDAASAAIEAWRTACSNARANV